MTQHILELTADEIMLLVDRVRAENVGTEPHSLSAYPLLLRLGSAYLDAFGDGTKRTGEIPVAVSEAEAWLLRSHVTSSDRSPADALLGVRLLCKIFRVLLAYNSPQIPDADAEGQELTEADRQSLMRRNEPYRRPG